MQFPVPQFTDVEDRIIGPLTLKQFGIIFGVGVIIFLGYSATKSILVLVFLFMLFGLPGLGLAFAKINGRPVYNSLGNFAKFYSSPKLLIFQKEAGRLAGRGELKDAQMSSPAPAPAPAQPAETADERLKKVTELLRQTSASERDIAGKLH